MSISTLSLAVGSFDNNDIRIIDVNKKHSTNYHVYYRKNGKNRVMLVPKDCDNLQQLQQEVQILLSRDNEEQLKIGVLDGNK